MHQRDERLAAWLEELDLQQWEEIEKYRMTAVLATLAVLAALVGQLLLGLHCLLADYEPDLLGLRDFKLHSK